LHRFFRIKFKLFKERLSSSIEKRLTPIDDDIFNRTKSFFITSDEDVNKLPIALPLPVNEFDFSRANVGLNLSKKTTPESNVENYQLE